MAAVPVTISGVLCDKLGRTIQSVTLVGEASFTGLGVGGGPIVPPGAGGGPGDAHPEHPIYYPPGIWGPTDPRPTPPIHIPPEIPTEPPPDGGDKPPPEGSGGWGFVGEWSRWGYFPPPTAAQPKA